ncbi:MAG: anti-sigma factor [Rhodobacteraceae bacterium]|nr:anti-sigma factor [Paracoccaceae bacterium]
MTTDRDIPEMDDREGLAAEYVLGTLPPADRARAESMIASDPAFAASVADWTALLSPLDAAFPEVPPPPGLFERTEARLFPVSARPAPARSSLRFWLGLLAGGALAAAVALAVLPPVARGPVVVAELRAEDRPLVMRASFDAAAGRLTVARVAGPPAAAGRDYQLWLIPAGQAPVPIGLVREGELAVGLAGLPAGATLAVSDEPLGGSPTGQPTGAVLVAAVVGG